jgi:hypothetical protein
MLNGRLYRPRQTPLITLLRKPDEIGLLGQGKSGRRAVRLFSALGNAHDFCGVGDPKWVKRIFALNQ